MTIQYGHSHSLDISRFIETVWSGSPSKCHPLEFAPEAGVLEEMRLAVGQSLWSLPLPLDALERVALERQVEVLIFRDMKDRDPMRSVRCDAAIWLGDRVVTFHELTPHYTLNSYPSFVSADQSSTLSLTPRGLCLAPSPLFQTCRELEKGFEIAARMLLAQSGTRLVA